METKEDRKQLQFRLGEKLIKNVDVAVTWLVFLDKPDTPKNRTDFVLEAIQRRLDAKNKCVFGSTADVAYGNRKPFMIRVSRDLMDLIDKDADKQALSRTNWVIDAILAELARLSKQIADLAPYTYKVCKTPSGAEPVVRETE